MMIGLPQMEMSNPAGVAAPFGAYSHLATIPAGAELLVLAGQVGMMPDGSVAAGVEAQYDQALHNIVAILESRGATPRNIARITIYLTQPLDPQHAAAARRAVFGKVLPPATLVYVTRLARPELLVEIEAIAAIPSATRP